METQKFTIEEIRNYLIFQDSFGDATYNLNAENIVKANEFVADKQSDCIDPNDVNED